MMNKPSLILIGAGGHAHACVDVIEQHGRFQISGLVGVQEEVHTKHLGYFVLGTDSDLPELVKAYKYAFITVGQIKSPDDRKHLYERAAKLGFQFPAIVSPFAQVSRHAIVGAGTIVMHGAIVNAGAKLGNNCIVNTHAVIEHDVTVSDHCHISTGAIVNGNVYIGGGSFVGSGSIIKEGVALGSGCVVGMALSVRHNLMDGACFLGSERR